MTQALSISDSLIQRCLRRLDALSPGQSLAYGVPLGLAMGLAILTLRPPAWAAVGFLALLIGVTLLAFTGKAVVIEPIDQIAEKQPGLSGRLPEPPHPITSRELWVELAADTFLMGSPDEEKGRRDHEGPVHPVTVSAFQMMRETVTVGLWQELLGEGDRDENSRLPHTGITWYQAVEFCNALSTAEGLTPCYDIEDQEVRWNSEVDGYRLPTEAEWEYACRAGTTTRFSFGDDEEELAEYAWFAGNSEGKAHPVAEKEANPWGLFDMHGNVLEWCWDWYGAYDSEPAENPIGPEQGSSRILRGGAFAIWYGPRNLRSAFRGWHGPVLRLGVRGFRCVRGPRRQP